MTEPTDLNKARLDWAQRLTRHMNPFEAEGGTNDAELRDAWAFYCAVIGKTISSRSGSGSTNDSTGPSRLPNCSQRDHAWAFAALGPLPP